MNNKFPLLFFLGMAVIYMITCFLGPKDIFEVEHELILNTNSDFLFEKVNNLEYWNTWNDWLIGSNSDQLEYSRNLSGKGAKLNFNLDIGEGELEILESERNSKVKTRTIFKNWAGSVISLYTFEAINNNKTRIKLKVHNSKPTSFIVRGILFINQSKKNIQESTYNGLLKLEKDIQSQRAMNKF